jgi:AcrR family transcriptional regulator
MSSTQLTTRERILDVTWHLMEERRGQGVRIEEIAQAAEVSRQAVYLHFGSRSELLVATARYIDEVLGCEEKMRRARDAVSATGALETYVEAWGNYIPGIYGLAKALLAVRDTDEAAAAAWEDRMAVLYSICRFVIERLHGEGILSPDWTVEEATDFFWATISIRTWEHLMIDRGWTQEQYIWRLQMALKRTLLKSV